MKLSLEQTKFVGLTMELDLKAQEYKMLCKKLEQLKAKNINENDESLKELLSQFQKNHDEIVKIKEQLKELENIESTDQSLYHDYSEDIFKDRKETKKKEDALVEIKEEKWYKKIFAIFKSIFKM